MIMQPGSSRLLIYTYYDKDGIVDSYVPYLLSAIKECVSEVLVVINGSLGDEGRLKLEPAATHIVLRENKGFDIWGYKAGLDYYGWDGLERFDEVIFMNSTVMGPLHPFEDMFREMDTRDVDFWGITLYYGLDYDPYGKTGCGFIPEHIQSYFTAVRKHMLLSNEHREYWDNLPDIGSYEDAIALHEAVYTGKFDDYGFSRGVYIDTGSRKNYSDNAAVFDPLWLIRDRKCPVIKRRCFFNGYHHYMSVCTGEIAVQALNYIRDNLDYDTDMIWETILRTSNLEDIYRALALNFILPSEKLSDAGVSPSMPSGMHSGSRSRAALIFHAYYADLFDAFYPYIAAMPEDADIIFTTDTQEKKERLLSLYSDCRRAGIKVLPVENRGRSEAALLIAARDVIFDYDYICFAHDKKNPASIRYGITGQSFAYKCYENILASRCFSENVLAVFENNPRLGLLSPPPPIHAEYFHVVMNGDWKINYGGVTELAQKLGLNVDIKPDKAPPAPLGGMMWFRTAAMKKLFEYGWKYGDFPQEPACVDGTVLHMIERIYPLVAQDAGFYTARLYSSPFAAIEITNLSYYLCELTKAAANLCGSGGIHHDLVNALYYTANNNALLADIESWKELYYAKFEQCDNIIEQFEAAKGHIAGIEAEKAELLGSASWKLTAPLRAFLNLFKR